MINIEEEIRFLEDAAKKATDAVEFEEKESKRLEEENIRLQEEKEKMKKRIETEQGDLAKYQERQAKAAAQKADLENQVGDTVSAVTCETSETSISLTVDR